MVTFIEDLTDVTHNTRNKNVHISNTKLKKDDTKLQQNIIITHRTNKLYNK